jgi:hypothetical protein
MENCPRPTRGSTTFGGHPTFWPFLPSLRWMPADDHGGICHHIPNRAFDSQHSWQRSSLAIHPGSRRRKPCLKSRGGSAACRRAPMIDYEDREIPAQSRTSADNEAM